MGKNLLKILDTKGRVNFILCKILFDEIYTLRCLWAHVSYKHCNTSQPKSRLEIQTPAPAFRFTVNEQNTNHSHAWSTIELGCKLAELSVRLNYPQFSSELTVIIKVAPINDLNAICIKTEALLISEGQLQTCQSLNVKKQGLVRG